MAAITRELLDEHLRHSDDRVEARRASCRRFFTEERESGQRLFDARFNSIMKRQGEQLESFRAD